MYKIIGADGKEYGPVSAEQLRQWLTEGRVNQQTRVLAEGGTDWKALGEVAEMATSTLPPPPSPISSLRSSNQSDIRRMVRGPAVFILVLSILNIIATIVGVVIFAYKDRLMEAFGLPAQSSQLQSRIDTFFSLPATIIGGLLAVACVIGALRMMKLQSHSLAIATAIMMLIPCGGCLRFQG